METITSTDGTTLAFDRYGDGPALVLVAGATAHRAISPNIPALAAHIGGTVVAYDRRGRGDSGDTAPYATEREIEDLAAVIAATGGAAAVFGHSSGAVLALDAVAAGLPITRLAVYEPPFVVDGSRPPVPRDYLARLDSSDSPRERLEILMTEAVGLPPAAVEGIEQWPVWPQLASVAPTIAYDSRFMEGLMFGDPLPHDRWAGVTVPTLVMAGGASDGYLRTGASELTALLPAATLRVLDGQDHGPSDDVLGAVLREFLR